MPSRSLLFWIVAVISFPSFAARTKNKTPELPPTPEVSSAWNSSIGADTQITLKEQWGLEFFLHPWGTQSILETSYQGPVRFERDWKLPGVSLGFEAWRPEFYEFPWPIFLELGLLVLTREARVPLGLGYRNIEQKLFIIDANVGTLWNPELLRHGPLSTGFGFRAGTQFSSQSQSPLDQSRVSWGWTLSPELRETLEFKASWIHSADLVFRGILGQLGSQNFRGLELVLGLRL